MIVIAHRGYSSKFPENTVSAFGAAIEASADMIEFDVLVSKDGVPVVIHDEELERTTRYKGKVTSLTLQEIQNLDAGNGEKIPTLEEVLEFTSGKIPLHVEIKPEAAKADPLIEKKVVDLLETHGHMNCVVSSFSLPVLQRIRELNRDLSVAHTFHSSLTDLDRANVEKLGAMAIHLPIHKVRPDDIDFALAQDLTINVFTVNTIAQMKHAQDLCVNGVFTNEVDQAIKFFTKRGL